MCGVWFWEFLISIACQGENSLDTPLFSLDDVTQAIADAVTTDGKTFDITVSRQNMLERGLMQWQSPKKTSPTDQLKVSFLGEAGIDTGVLRKEFLTGMCSHHDSLFSVIHELEVEFKWYICVLQLVLKAKVISALLTCLR